MPPNGPVPIEWCLDGRDVTEPRPRPGGRDVASVVRWNGASAIVLVDMAGGPERLLTTSPAPAPGRGMGGGCYEWLPDASAVVYVAVDGELWIQTLAGAPRRLTEFGRSCRAPSVAPDGTFVAVVVDEAEVWVVELPRAAATPVDAGPNTVRCHRVDDGADEFCFDPSVAPGSDAIVWSAWSPPAMPWDDAHVARVAVGPGVAVSAVERWRPEGSAVQQPRLLANGVLAVVHDGSGWLNVYLGDDPVVAEAAEHGDPPWGMGQRSYALSPDGRHVAVARNAAGFGSLGVVELASGRVTVVAGGVHGQLHWEGEHLVALRSAPDAPTSVVVYDAATATASGVEAPSWRCTEVLVGPVEGWRHVGLPEPEAVVVRHTAARHPDRCDGVDDNDVVTLHVRRYAAGHSRMLCWVHGGPTDQWRGEFRPRIAYWWSRGWDVLVVDPRGTTGHGRSYRTALEGGWGRVDVDDTAALLRHAHREGWATPASTVMMGGSSGGLTVLGVLADHGHLVAGGVSSYPVSDLADLAATTHRFEAHYTDSLVGDPLAPDMPQRLRQLSPLYRAELIAGPLLVFHGSDDPVVPVAQTYALVERIRAAGGVVDVTVYEGEGHGFRDREHQLHEYARTERFLGDLVGPG